MPIPMKGFGQPGAGKKLLQALIDQNPVEGVEKRNIMSTVTKKPGTANIPPETTPKAVGGEIPIEYISKLKANIKGTKEYKNFIPEPPEDIKGLTEVSNKDGVPKIVYHGTTKNIKDFSGEPSSTANPSTDLANVYGTHFTSSEDDALFYAKGGFYGAPTKNSKVFEAYLDIRNPYNVRKTEQILSQFSSHVEAKKWMIKQGYDGLHIVPEEGKIEWWVPFERDQIIRAAREKIPRYQHEAIIALDGANGNIDEAFRVLKGWNASQKSIDFINKIAKESLPNQSRLPEGGGQLLNALENPSNLKTIIPMLGTAGILYPQTSEAFGKGASLTETISKMGMTAPAGATLQSWRDPQRAEQESLQEPLVDPTTLLAGPARWGGGVANMAFDSLLKLLMGQ